MSILEAVVNIAPKFKIAAAGVCAATIVGAGIGAGVDAYEPTVPLNGMITDGVLPVTHAPVQVMTVYGASLVKGNRYTFSGVSVHIKGDLAPGVHIEGKDGQLVIEGNVGDKDELHVSVPEFTKYVQETCAGFRQDLVGFNTVQVGNTTVQEPIYITVPYDYDCSHTDDIGPKPPYDQDAAIIVKGKTGNKVSLSSSLGTKIQQLG